MLIANNKRFDEGNL